MGLKGCLSVVGCLAVGWLANTGNAIAAETVVLTYGFLSMDVPVADLEQLVETGETSDDLGDLLTMAGQEPDVLRSTLQQPIPLSPIALDYALNSPPGEWMLDQVSETIHPASGEAGKLALRSALIGASSDDREFTLLEVMQVYPSPEIVVRGDRLVETYNRIHDVLEPLEDLADILGSLEF
ncbi:alpha/beta hydrolase [Oscillatoria sp. CS-180]|uniref:alpha/beta hydrolase n=1 Tax=Oscillatoria sp. CS-180 TaxID=3021720 RepID=UPI00232E21BA|nr:alpha/beta hydrolase [Oscillatoria sp. CS-180]MDB9526820.1 alpha/beta hydrolase [Oscillatoria sp. CS-180]